MENAVLFLGLINIVLCQGSYYISQETSRWSEQNQNCTPVTPKVEAVADMGYVVTEDLGADLPINERVWSAYYQVQRVFEYIGCISMRNLINYEARPYIKIQGYPGQCFPGCGDDIIIGVTGTKCYCLGADFNVQDRTETKCTDVCNGPFVACGNDFTPIKYSYLSIYKMNTDVATVYGASDVQSCLSIDPVVPRSFSWVKCTMFLRPRCANGDSVQTIKPKSEPKYFSWTGAANVCFRYNIFPTKYSNSKHVDRQNGSLLWTGVFITNVVYRHDKVVPANRRFDSKRFGYLTKASDNRIKLQFTVTESFHKRLCYKEIRMDSTTIQTTFSKRATSSKDVHNTPNDMSPAVYIVTGICVLLVVLLFTVAIACLYRRRLSNHASIQVNYLTPAHMAALNGNNVHVPAINRTDLQSDESDLASQHYYTSPAEVVYPNLQTLDANRQSETYQSIKEEEQGEGTLKCAAKAGVYESLQDSTATTHNYDTLISTTYESVKESMKDVHVYGELHEN